MLSDYHYAQDDLPSVDPALIPFIDKLLDSVIELKNHRQHVITYITREKSGFPIYLQTLEQNMSIVFHTSHTAHVNVKRAKNVNVSKATWRHDHDALLRHLFKRPANTSNLDNRDLAVGTSLETKLRFAKREILENKPSVDLTKQMCELAIYLNLEELEEWIVNRGGQVSEATDENNYQTHVSSRLLNWLGERTLAREGKILQLGEDPSTGTCDVFGYLSVIVPGTLHKDLDGSQLVWRGDTRGEKHNSCAAGCEKEDKVSSTTSQPKHMPRVAETTEKLLAPSRSAFKKPQLRSERKSQRYNITSASLSSTIASWLPDNVDALDTELQDMKIGNKSDSASLELPVIIVEHKKQSEEPEKATNIRMYLISAVKFLETLGISGVPIFGIQTDSRYAFFPAAVIKDDGIIHLFERQVEKVDISTPLGAWHYATVVAWLAFEHSMHLKNVFDAVRKDLGENKARLAAWTIDH
ncbi:hypothetical protein AX17_006015, partial [Amanita inopinata Kibby_2008]